MHQANSNDSDLPRRIRVFSLLAAGIEVIGAADHNHHTDYADVIDALDVKDRIVSLPGNEITVDAVGHFNVFPVEVDPGAERGGAPAYEALAGRSARELFDLIRSWPGDPIVQVNHARLRWAAYFDNAGWDGESWPPPMPVDFDLLEVLGGLTAFSTPEDERVEQAVDDFYTLVAHGVFVTAVGNSDTHDVIGRLAGFPRTYVRVDDARTWPFDEAGFLDALREGHAVATTGPWLELFVDGAQAGELVLEGDDADDRVHVDLHLEQASWVRATRIRLWVGGSLRRTFDVPAGAREFRWSGDLDVGPRDTWIGADASGDEVIPYEWTGDTMAYDGYPGLVPYALVNPVRIDVDGGGFAYPGSPPDPDADLVPVAPPPDAPDCHPMPRPHRSSVENRTTSPSSGAAASWTAPRYPAPR